MSLTPSAHIGTYEEHCKDEKNCIDDTNFLYATKLNKKYQKLTIVETCGFFFGVVNPSLDNNGWDI
jgi:hypothetical protein